MKKRLYQLLALVFAILGLALLVPSAYFGYLCWASYRPGCGIGSPYLLAGIVVGGFLTYSGSRAFWESLHNP